MHMQPETKLFQIVATRHPPCGFSGRLHGRQEQAYENADNGYHDKQLDKCKSIPPPGGAIPHSVGEITVNDHGSMFGWFE
tara:strand:+ start:88 stop:327 length:240 start_codon:yes stop_codon:yes gene_type:complete